MSKRGDYDLNGIFLADSDKQNLDQLISLFRMLYGINPQILENEQIFREYIQQPEGGSVFIRVDTVSVEGLKLSALAMEFSPAIQLVWMAANESYALDAFSHGADAYLLLPAKEENLSEVMKTLDFRQNKIKQTQINAGGKNEK